MQNYKVKVGSLLDSGDKIEFEAFVEAANYEAAVAEANTRFVAAVKELAGQDSIEIGKVKLEIFDPSHHHC